MRGNYENLVALAERIETVERTKEDYLVHTGAMEMDSDTRLVVRPNGHSETFQIGEVAHGQIAARLGIPAAYYARMAEVPGLRTHNVNTWLKTQDEKRMVRTLGGIARAYLSDRFRPYDNYDVLQGLLPVLRQHEGLQVHAPSLTEKRMYIQFLFPALVREVKPGVRVGAGLMVSNSEVGLGSVDVRSFVMNYVCSNGAIAESILSQYHVGRRVADADYGVYKSDTVEADVRAFQLQLRDIVAVALDEARFEKKVTLMRGAAVDVIENPVATVEKVTKRFCLTEQDGENVVANLIKGGDSTRWGLSNAITALAHQIENPDRQYEIEKTGWDIVKLSRGEWEILN